MKQFWKAFFRQIIFTFHTPFTCCPAICPPAPDKHEGCRRPSNARYGSLLPALSPRGASALDPSEGQYPTSNGPQYHLHGTPLSEKPTTRKRPQSPRFDKQCRASGK